MAPATHMPQLDGFTRARSLERRAGLARLAHAGRLRRRGGQGRADARKGAVQVRPPFHTYGAGRGMKRIQIDLKAPPGVAAFLRLAAAADVVIESYRPGVVDRLGIGYEDVQAREPTASSTARPAATGRTVRRSSWAGHDINYLAMARLPRLLASRAPTAGRRFPAPPSPTAPAAACTR